LFDVSHHLFFIEEDHFRIAADYLLTLLGKLPKDRALSSFWKKQLVYVVVIVKIVEFDLGRPIRPAENSFESCSKPLPYTVGLEPDKFGGEDN
jgi:hypothetical protein